MREVGRMAAPNVVDRAGGAGDGCVAKAAELLMELPSRRCRPRVEASLDKAASVNSEGVDSHVDSLPP